MKTKENIEIRKNELEKEWHPIKNGELKIENFSFGSHKKVWWLCEKNHEWPAEIKNRYDGNNCPYCSENLPSKENNLLIKNPEIASQWHPTKNGNLKPENVCPSSGKKVWWLCEKGHEWPATINHRKNNRGCPICSNRIIIVENSLLIKNPKVANEWHPTKNGDLRPEMFAPNSSKKVWWLCSKNHEWPAQISKRNGGKNCPFCAGNLPTKENNLLIKNPEVASQWHPTKNGNLKPENICPKSNKKVWWICDKGHEYEKVVSDRYIGQGCPICFERNSKAGIEWLNKYGIPNDKTHREVPLRISVRKRYYADGFIPETKTICEFLGDYWHGNPKIYNEGINKNNKKTFKQLYEETLKKFKILYSLGFTIIYRWESEDTDKIFDGVNL
jgi:hypothetical protein